MVQDRISRAELRILPSDFERFRPEVQRNPEYNAERLEVRRKLDAIGKLLVKFLSKQVSLTSRASLHHPYRFNRFKVDSQWVYLSRSDKERKALKRILGVELGKDLDQNYVHVLMVVEIHQHGLEFAVRVHKDAWWDGENLKRRTANATERDDFAERLRALPEYGFRVDDFKRVHNCATIDGDEIASTLKYYTPGEHWLHIAREIRRDDALLEADDFVGELEKEFTKLLSVYDFMLWSPENNFLFEE